MLNLAEYNNLTEDEVEDYVATLTIPEPNVRLEDDKIYKDGKLWFMTECEISLEEIKRMAEDEYITNSCTEHFADRYKPPELPEMIEPEPPKIITNEDIMTALKEQKQADLDRDELQIAILLNQEEIKLGQEIGR